jgi:hypothetical protein
MKREALEVILLQLTSNAKAWCLAEKSRSDRGTEISLKEIIFVKKYETALSYSRQQIFYGTNILRTRIAHSV